MVKSSIFAILYLFCDTIKQKKLESEIGVRFQLLLAAAINTQTPKQDPVSRWAPSLAERRGYWRAVVAIAAKNARMRWAALLRGEVTPNVEVSGLRGFLRRSARLPGWGAGLAMTYT